jgi:hypothetical protein
MSPVIAVGPGIENPGTTAHTWSPSPSLKRPFPNTEVRLIS